MASVIQVVLFVLFGAAIIFVYAWLSDWGSKNFRFSLRSLMWAMVVFSFIAAVAVEYMPLC